MRKKFFKILEDSTKRENIRHGFLMCQCPAGNGLINLRNKCINVFLLLLAGKGCSLPSIIIEYRNFLLIMLPKQEKVYILNSCSPKSIKKLHPFRFFQSKNNNNNKKN